MKAMVLCAGFGTRLGDLTRDWPKPMLDIQGRPLLAYILGHLRSQGCREIAVNLHFRPEVIQDWFGDGSSWGLDITYSHEASLLGTAGGVRNVADFFRGEEAFLVQYGDVLTDQPLEPLFRKHRESGALATLFVHPRPRSNSVISLDESGRITGFLERPTEQARQGNASPWVNSGICVCSPRIFDHIAAEVPSDLPRDVFVPLANTGRLFALPLTGYRCAIDSPERLAEARAAVADGRCKVTPFTPPAPRVDLPCPDLA